FSILSFLVAIPSAVKVFNWTATLYKGSVSWETPMLYAYGFIGLFTIGGLTGLFLAAIAVDVHVTDTYFVIAHFHYIMVGGTIMGYLGGLHFWWPKISGRLYNEGLAKLSAGIIFIGFNLTFFPQFVLGYLGMPRRYHAYPPEFQVLNVLSSAGASILGVGYLIPMAYLMWSLRYGRLAASSRELVVVAGTINTFVLITSSLTMALAVRAAQLGARRLLLIFLALTMLLGCVFLGVKAFEYYREWAEHHIPGAGFEFSEP